MHILSHNIKVPGQTYSLRIGRVSALEFQNMIGSYTWPVFSSPVGHSLCSPGFLPWHNDWSCAPHSWELSRPASCNCMIKKFSAHRITPRDAYSLGDIWFVTICWNTDQDLLSLCLNLGANPATVFATPILMSCAEITQVRCKIN